MKSIEQMIFETRFKGEEFNANEYNDWAKENELEAYTICLAIAKQLQQSGISGKRLSCQKECGNIQPSPDGLICLNCGSSLKAVCVCGAMDKTVSAEGWCDYFVDRMCDCKKGDFCKGTL